ncbi:MAG TPA: MliC family protein, partial [Candidatus Paceibacterota bacterium]|nr:MliC family protein [Candidatus Paceibacterota bacterium]
GEQRAEIKIYSQQTEQILSQQNNNNQVINSVVFQCIDNKSIRAIFFRDKVELSLSDQRNMVLMQAISASGARYANTDESIVFWNKGDTAFIQEGDVTTYENCVVVPAESAE